MILPWVVVPPSNLTGATFIGRYGGKARALSLASQDFRAMPIDRISPYETNLPFGSATRYTIRSEEQLACSATLEHYLKMGSLYNLPWATVDGLLSTFFLVPKGY